MKTHRTIGLTLVSLALILSILACGGGKSATPTPAKAEPVATKVSVEEPTATDEAAQPTAKPTAKAPKASATPKGEQPTKEATISSSGCADLPDGELGVAYVTGYQDTLDSWRVIGLVCNKTSGAVDNIQLDIELFDKAGKSLYKEANVYTALSNVDAGEETPFSLSVYDKLDAPDKVKATITSSDSVDIKRAAIDTQGVVTTVDDQGNLHITGELINNGSDPVEIHGVAAATFDKDGKMFTADYSSVLIHYLAPGVSGPFRITMYGPKDGTDVLDTYQLYMDAETADKQTFLIDAEKDLSELKDYVDNYGQFHLVGELTNNGDKNIGVRLVATIYDKDNNILDASEVDTAISAVKPGETIPYEFNYWGPLDSKKGLFDDKADRFTVQVDPTWTWTTDTELLDLTTKDDSNEWDEYQGTFKGQVVNDTGGDLDSVVVMVGLYGKKGQPDEGKLVATGYTYADIKDTLAKGKTAEYTVYVPIPKDFNIDNFEYEIVVKGKQP
jgi:hypothetical protein